MSIVRNIVNLGGDRSDDTEVVAGAAHSPPQILMLVFGNGNDLAVCGRKPQGYELVTSDSVLSLQDTVTATEGWSEVANALTNTMDCDVSNRNRI